MCCRPLSCPGSLGVLCAFTMRAVGATLLLSRSFLPSRAFLVVGGFPFSVLIFGGCEQVFPKSEGLKGAGEKSDPVLSKSSSFGVLIFIGMKGIVCVGGKVVS